LNFLEFEFIYKLNCAPNLSTTWSWLRFHRIHCKLVC